MTSTPVTEIPRESGPEWVPVDVTVIVDGSPATSVTIQFAVLPRYARPGVSDWVNPVSDPGSGSGIGVVVNPVASRGEYGIFVKVGSGSLETIVLEPTDVGLINRT